MPVKTLQELGFDPNSGVMLGDIGTGAGAFPQPPVMNYIDQQNAQRRQALTTPPAFRSRVTYYAPGPGDKMEGPWATSRPNPATGQRIPSTLDDVRLGRSPYVTVASDPSRYGQRVQLGDLTYRSPIDGKTYTVPQVQGVVHDTGSAFKGRPDKLDVAAGDFRGWNPTAASAYVQADAGTRMVTPNGWETTVGGSPGGEGGVAYSNPARAAQGATTNPADLEKVKEQGNFLSRLLAGFDFRPATPAKAAPLGFGDSKLPLQFAPVGQRRGR